MAIRVGINGFGRIGRLVARVMFEREDFELVAVNDLADAASLAPLLKYDSTHRALNRQIEAKDDAIVVDGKEIKVLGQRDPAQLPWGDMGIDIAIESTGVFRLKEQCMMHVQAGAKKVLLTVPAKDEVDATVVLGVNDEVLKAEDLVISNASCTTNCLAPMVKVLNDSFGIVQGLMTTVHAMTSTQKVADGPSGKLWRDGRAASVNIIPASTGAAKAVGKVIPALNGKLTGMSFRVPVQNVSVIDLTCRLEKAASYDEVKGVMKAASEGTMKGILGYTEDNVVSSDFIGEACTSIFDAGAGISLNPYFVKVISWYDNEWGYSCRVLDLIAHMERVK